MRRAAAAVVIAAVALLDAKPRAFVEVQTRAFTGVQPQLAALGDRVFLAFSQDNVISVVQSADGGQAFRSLATLTVPGRVSLGMHRGPRIAVTARALMVTVVAGAKGGGADGDLLLYRSVDDGATWAAPAVINDVPGSPREGLHAFAATPAGQMALAWLDLREKGTRIYTATSRDHGATWSADHLAYASPSGSVCECCHPSVAISTDASIALMFRNNLDGNRDLYVTRSQDGAAFAPPQKSGVGAWALNACPMDGGGVVFDRADVVSVWRREDAVYRATLGAAEARLGPGRDPAIAQFGAHQDIAWSSPAGIVLMRDGRTPITLGDGRFPAVLALKTRTVVAWEFQGSAKVLSIPR